MAITPENKEKGPEIASEERNRARFFELPCFNVFV